MVLFFTSTSTSPPSTIYMGKDKVENEDLIKYGDEYDVWFHVDKLSSAHVYLRLMEGITWNNIPQPLLEDCAQLVKANSIEGNKKNDQIIIYTPWSNIKKSGDMAVGAVSFQNDRIVKRYHVRERENTIINRLNKTKKEQEVDYESVRIERQKEKNRKKRELANELKNAELCEARRRREEKEARDYSSLHSGEAMEEARNEKERQRRAREQEKAERAASGEIDEEDEGTASDDSFM